MMNIPRHADMIFRFGLSAVGCLLVDKVVFAIVLGCVMGHAGRSVAIALAQVVARAVSGHCNYFCNRVWVFGSEGGARSYWGYWALVLAKGGVLVAGTWGVSFALDLHGQFITLANIVLEMVLFVISFVIQKIWIFQSGGK